MYDVELAASLGVCAESIKNKGSKPFNVKQLLIRRFEAIGCPQEVREWAYLSICIHL